MSVYFNYSHMGNGKSLALLSTAHNYEENGYRVILFTSDIGCREKIGDCFGYVESRIGVKRKAYLVKKDTTIWNYIAKPNLSSKTVLMFDECQFYDNGFIESLFLLSIEYPHIPILAYGLMTDFKLQLFEGSKRFIELGAKLQKMKGVSKKTVNSLWVDGEIQTKGDSVQIGREEKYKVLTLEEYWRATGRIKQN